MHRGTHSSYSTKARRHLSALRSPTRNGTLVLHPRLPVVALLVPVASMLNIPHLRFLEVKSFVLPRRISMRVDRAIPAESATPSACHLPEVSASSVATRTSRCAFVHRPLGVRAVPAIDDLASQKPRKQALLHHSVSPRNCAKSKNWRKRPRDTTFPLGVPPFPPRESFPQLAGPDTRTCRDGRTARADCS